ncbi:hypothetical protein DL93DRAFT_2230769 [Clavulina sp. PMI_390]|nr:hypothetical protein DL93DRAFT_2230769 [Clavulina sp. PMI_390]
MASGQHPIPSLGTSLIGNILASTLFGIITVQTVLYFNRFSTDPRWIKAMVTFYWVAESVQAMLTSRGLYRNAMFHYTVPPPRYTPNPWDLNYWGIHVSVASIAVQTFFSYRLWTLSRHRVYNLVVSSLIIGNGMLGIHNTAGVYASHGKQPVPLRKLIVFTSLSVTIDLALTLGVTMALRKHRTGFLQTDRILNWINLYGVATGALTSCFALVLLFCTVTGRRKDFLVAAVPLGGIYITSALAHLHSRSALRAQLSGELRLPTNTPQSFEMHSPPGRRPCSDTQPCSTNTDSSSLPSLTKAGSTNYWAPRRALTDAMPSSSSPLPPMPSVLSHLDTVGASQAVETTGQQLLDTLQSLEPETARLPDTERTPIRSPNPGSSAFTLYSGIHPSISPTAMADIVRRPPSFNPTELFTQRRRLSSRNFAQPTPVNKTVDAPRRQADATASTVHPASREDNGAARDGMGR